MATTNNTTPAEAQENVLLDVQDVAFSFRTYAGEVQAVRGVSFTLARGKCLGIVGESGCGKSVMAKSIIRLNPGSPKGIYKRGQILFEGRDLLSLSKRAMESVRAREIRMIFQDPMASLNPRKKVIDIVAEGLDANHMYRTKEEREQKVFDILEKVGLNHEQANRYPHMFSGGQRQRVGIARAMVMEPEIIIADECISALDVSIQAQVVNIMKQLQEERGLTYLFIAHDLSVVRFISDRIAVIRKGRIVELSEAEELFRHPLHPYTKSLLSAVPNPNPAIERNKKLLVYDPSMHDYSVDKPEWVEILPGHFVYGNTREMDGYRRELAAM